MNLKDSDFEYNLNILFGFVSVGVIILYSTKGAAIWGLVWIFLSLFGILFTSWAMTSRKRLEYPVKKILPLMLFQSIPTLIILFLISWLIQIITSNYSKISSGEVPLEFSRLYNAVILVLAMQFYCLMKHLKTLIKENPDGPRSAPILDFKDPLKSMKSMGDNQMDIILYGLALLTFVLILMIWVVLKFFITDG